MRRQAATRAGVKAAAALPIRFGRKVIAVLELFSDRPHPPNDVLVNLMNDVSIQIGKVLERERSMAEMADLAWREQQACCTRSTTRWVKRWLVSGCRPRH